MHVYVFDRRTEGDPYIRDTYSMKHNKYIHNILIEMGYAYSKQYNILYIDVEYDGFKTMAYHGLFEDYIIPQKLKEVIDKIK